MAYPLLALSVRLKLLQVPAFVLRLQVLNTHGFEGVVQLVLISTQQSLLTGAQGHAHCGGKVGACEERRGNRRTQKLETHC